MQTAHTTTLYGIHLTLCVTYPLQSYDLLASMSWSFPGGASLWNYPRQLQFCTCFRQLDCIRLSVKTKYPQLFWIAFGRHNSHGGFRGNFCTKVSGFFTMWKLNLISNIIALGQVIVVFDSWSFGWASPSPYAYLHIANLGVLGRSNATRRHLLPRAVFTARRSRKNPEAMMWRLPCYGHAFTELCSGL